MEEYNSKTSRQASNVARYKNEPALNYNYLLTVSISDTNFRLADIRLWHVQTKDTTRLEKFEEKELTAMGGP